MLLDAIDALMLQRSYAFASKPGEGNPASVGVLGNADAWPEAPASGEATALVRPAAAEDAAEEALALPNLAEILKFHVASGKVLSS